MGEVQVVTALHDVVRKFIAQRKAYAVGLAIVAYYIQAGQLGFFAGIFSKGRFIERTAGANHDRAVALVEPLRLHAHRAGCRAATFNAPLKNTCGVGHGAVIGCVLLVHLVACRGAAQVGQAGAADQAVGRICMVQRREYAALLQCLAITDRTCLGATGQHFSDQAVAFTDGLQGQFAGGFGAQHHMDLIALDHPDVALALSCFKLDQAHTVNSRRLFLWRVVNPFWRSL